ncbi:MAG: hypothetical protein QMD77_01420 [Patescibacteria group bacterium]|nr:hypothetical protein [Patescibacteria group bacterium]
MEKDPKKSEENNETSENGRENMKVWFQENLRMLVSIVIVVVIAGGIYAYSKRTQPSVSQKETAVSEEGEGKISVIGGETSTEETTEGQPAETEKPAAAEETTQPKAAVSSAETSQETENSFIETAVKGDSTTKLARRALANYLEKNPDTSLTAEHKIYVEDMLRRQVSNGRIKVGDSREFSKNMISNAVEKSKGLSDKQLQNLEKYSSKVPGLK